MNYFLYIRKSTDEDDRQVLSLEAQEVELNEFAAREHLTIVDTFRESQTAKQPGRLLFNEMLARVERGEAEGILAWHPDRLARNSVDGGRIIFLVDSGKIKSLKFPTFWLCKTVYNHISSLFSFSFQGTGRGYILSWWGTRIA